MVKISVVVPVYNVESYLEKCLDSLINQTLNDIEIICIDDGSTDSSLNILREYHNIDSRIKIISRENKGPSQTRNEGILLAKGEYLTFVDADDWIELNTLEKIYENAISNNSEVVLFNSIEHRKNNQFHERIYMKINNNIDYNNFTFNYKYNKRLIMNNMFVVWSKLYKTSFLKETNIIFPDNFKMFEDVPFHIETMLFAKRISYVPEILYNYNKLNLQSSQSKHTNFNNRLVLFEIFDLVEEMLVTNNLINEFELNFIEFKLLQSKENLNRLPQEFKNEFYLKMRKEFIKMRLKTNILKEIPLELYKFYIQVINYNDFEKFERFNENLNTDFKYINKKDLLPEIENFDKIGIELNNNYSESLIVSLTSFPQRMYDLHYCLYSLLTQSLKPNKVVLWLAEDQFPNKEKDIPENVLKLKKNGLTIKWCENIKSYKKLIPSLKEYPNDYIVTADDDIYYPKDWLKNLWEGHLKYPNSIISTRSRRIIFDDENNVDKYINWLVSSGEREPSYLNFPTNGGGTLFYPNALSEHVLDDNLYLKLCPSGDDIWFWAMMVLNKTKIYSIEESMLDITYVNISREFNLLNDSTLWGINQHGQNDIQLNNIFKFFPEILDIIS